MTFRPELNPEPHNRQLALALIQVVQMWSNPRYQPFLNCEQPDELTDEWFSWFVGSWNVARNIKDGAKNQVRNYLDCTFRRALLLEDSGECVDAAARHIQQQGWSSRGCFPVSLTSKVGFFLRPDRFVPLDRFSKKGLNSLRKGAGRGRLKHKSYKAYLNVFDEEYTSLEGKLRLALNEPWVHGMAKWLGCPQTALDSVTLRRKLFDDFLMHIANYGA